MIITFMPSLQHLAVVRTAIELWNHKDNRALLLRYYYTNDFQKILNVWLDVEDKIIAKVPKLKLPQSLENKLLNVIKPIGIEMLKWCVHHEKFLESNRKQVRKSINKLCWTPQGTVDSKKTAEMLIKGKIFTVSNRYILACIYCLENDVLDLWNKMSERNRSYFYRECYFFNWYKDLVFFWTLYINGKEADLEDIISERSSLRISWLPFIDLNYTLYIHMFLAAAVTSKSATEYFLKKLNCEYKEELLVYTAGRVAFRCPCTSSYCEHPYECNSEIILFLFSQIQNMMADKKAIYLLDWPWQNSFVEIPKPYSKLFWLEAFIRMVDKVKFGFRDYNYLKLLRETWQEKDRMDHLNISDCKFYELPSYQELLLKLLILDDKETFELILQDTIPSKREHILCNIDMNIFESLVTADKWDSLKYFILKCKPCKCKMVIFKEQLKDHISSSRTKRKLKEEKDLWSKFFTFVDQLAEEIYKKRSSEEGDNKPAKRLCNVECRGECSV